MKSQEPFGRWLIRQAIAGMVLIVFIVVAANVLPDLVSNIFQTALEESISP